VREESHLDDMRSAIRGDFERLAERRGVQELLREPEPGVDLGPEPELDPEPELESEPEPEPARDLAPGGGAVISEPEPAGEPAAELSERPSKSLLDRILKR
jgi:hypothetical protein